MKKLLLGLAALLLSTQLYAQTSISGLGALVAPAGSDLLPIVDVSDTTQGVGGSTKKVTVTVLGAHILESVNTIAEIETLTSANIITSTEIDTITEINALTTDDDVVSLAGTQTISGAKTLSGSLNAASGTVVLPSSTSLPGSCVTDGTVYVDTNATSGQRLFVCESGTFVLQGDGGGGGGGDIDAVVAGSGLTGGATSGTATLDVGEGLAIDVSADAVAFDPTELTGSRTFGDASTDTIVWTINRATGTDPTITFNDGSIEVPGLTIAGTAVAGFTDPGADSLIFWDDSESDFAAYAGIDCTNQFVRDVAASGAGTCASVAIGADVSGLGSNVAALLATFSTANFFTAISGESGSGAVLGGTAPTMSDATITGSMNIPNAAAPTTDAFGELAGDNNAWAASRGAPQWFDGTANVYLIGALASDTPGNGEVPTWNTGGTITWETPAGGGDVTAVGDCATTACFGGASGTTLTFDDADGDKTFLYDTTNNRFQVNAPLAIGSAGVTLTDDGDGALTLKSISAGSQEDLTLNFDDTANTIVASSSTGVTKLDMGAITIDMDGGDSLAATASANDNDTSIATTAYVQGELAAYASDTVTFTNKTTDCAATGNVCTMLMEIQLSHPHLCDGTGATIGTTATALDYGHATFAHAADQAANYCEYRIKVPADINTAVDPTAYLMIRLNAGDTGTHRYVLSTVSQAASSSATGTVGTAINMDFAGDASGASGDFELVGATTLTGWGATMTANRLLVIRLARDGDAAQDASTQTSTELGLTIRVGVSQ